MDYGLIRKDLVTAEKQIRVFLDVEGLQDVQVEFERGYGAFGLTFYTPEIGESRERSDYDPAPGSVDTGPGAVEWGVDAAGEGYGRCVEWDDGMGKCSLQQTIFEISFSNDASRIVSIMTLSTVKDDENRQAIMERARIFRELVQK